MQSEEDLPLMHSFDLRNTLTNSRGLQSDLAVSCCNKNVVFSP